LDLVRNLQTRFGAHPGSCPVCTSVSSPRKKCLECENDHLSLSYPRLIRNCATYWHFPYVIPGSSLPAAQIYLYSFKYKFYLTFVASLGQGIDHLQPSFYIVKYNREDKADTVYNPRPTFVQTMCECGRTEYGR
jgi:hypothetical protein